MEMRPVYSRCERDPAAYAGWIGRMLGLPVAITSHGPRAREKEDLTSRSFRRQRLPRLGGIHDPEDGVYNDQGMLALGDQILVRGSLDSPGAGC